MEQSQYKSSRELKYLAHTQMSGHFGILIGTMFIPAIISFFTIEIIYSLIPTTTLTGYILNYIAVFIIQIFLSVMQAGACLIYLKTACHMPCYIGDLFHGYKNNAKAALIIGLLYVFIDSVCTIPCDILNVTTLSSINIDMSAITENSTLSEVMEMYSTVYSVMASYYMTALLCNLVSFLFKLMFVPVYYMLIDFPDWSVSTILNRSMEVMRGNKFRYVLLQLSFLPLILLSVFTCGLTLIWVIPYMHMASANFYLDIMAVRNKKLEN